MFLATQPSSRGFRSEWVGEIFGVKTYVIRVSKRD